MPIGPGLRARVPGKTAPFCSRVPADLGAAENRAARSGVSSSHGPGLARWEAPSLARQISDRRVLMLTYEMAQTTIFVRTHMRALKRY